MKRSEYKEIVNAVVQETGKRLDDAVFSKQLISQQFSTAISELPVIAAETTTEILIRAGLLQLDDEADC